MPGSTRKVSARVVPTRAASKENKRIVCGCGVENMSRCGVRVCVGVQRRRWFLYRHIGEIGLVGVYSRGGCVLR